MNMFTGCDCAEVFAARVQALADQAVGVFTLKQVQAIEPTSAQWSLHYQKLSQLLQSALDDYAEQHGEPDALQAVEAAEWLLRELKS
jgi:hypothetical protein